MTEGRLNLFVESESTAGVYRCVARARGNTLLNAEALLTIASKRVIQPTFSQDVAAFRSGEVEDSSSANNRWRTRPITIEPEVEYRVNDLRNGAWNDVNRVLHENSNSYTNYVSLAPLSNSNFNSNSGSYPDPDADSDDNNNDENDDESVTIWDSVSNSYITSGGNRNNQNNQNDNRGSGNSRSGNTVYQNTVVVATPPPFKVDPSSVDHRYEFFCANERDCLKKWAKLQSYWRRRNKHRKLRHQALVNRNRNRNRR